MADITETLLDYCDCDGHGCEPCYAAEVIRRLRAEIERLREREQDLRMRAEQDACEIERLRTAIDALLTDIDGDHRPEWSSDEAEAAGKEPWCCAWCGAADGSWPCVHRRALDELKEARRDR